MSYEEDDDELLLALQDMEPCGNCGKQGARVPCMSGCKEVFYCSKECMRNHASSHRLRCRNLRCSVFNDSSDSSESEWDSEEEEEEDSDNDVAVSSIPVTTRNNSKSLRDSKKKKKKSRELDLSEDLEKRIEEKILKRLRNQEETRIAMAIEQRMKEEQANWRDSEMNRIAMEVKQRLDEETNENKMTEEKIMKTVEYNANLDQSAQERLRKKVGNQLRKSGITESYTSRDSYASVDGGALPEKEAVNSYLRQSGHHVDDLPERTSEGQFAEAVPPIPISLNSESEHTVGTPASVDEEIPILGSKMDFLDSLKIVVWKSGPLGLKFFQNPKTGSFTMVGSIDAEATLAVASITRGDVLTTVNGQDVSLCDNNMIQCVLEAAEKPAILQFQSVNMDNIREYSVTWVNGPLGLTFKDVDPTQPIPIVHRLTKKAGSTAQKANIAVGDILVAINNIDTIALGSSVSISLLKKIQLPATLKFRGIGGTDTTTSYISTEIVSRQSEAVDMTPSPVREIIPNMNKEDEVILNRQPSKSLSAIAHQTFNDSDTSVSTTSNSVAPAEPGKSLSLQQRIENQMKYQNDLNRQIRSQSSAADLGSTVVESESDTYEIIWKDGPLGLTILQGVTKDDWPVIKRVTGKGNSEGIQFAQVGDCLISINGTSTRHVNFESVIQWMKEVPKPATLLFKSTNPVALKTIKDSVNNSPQTISAKEASRLVKSFLDQDRKSPSTYEVLWGDGPLGLTIDAVGGSSGTGGAYIKRLTSQGAASHLTENEIGDRLVSINDSDVLSLDFKSIVQFLTNVQRPVRLKFQQANLFNQNPVTNVRESATSHIHPHDYEVNWTGGALGISLHSGNHSRAFPCITRLTGSGCAAYLPSTAVGDLLVAINGKSIEGLEFSVIMNELKNLPKPISLQFRPTTRASSSSIPLRGSSYNSNRDTFGAQSKETEETQESQTEGDKFSKFHTPFLQNMKLSSGRRQRIVQSVKK